jgi:hypothetical protein
MDVETIARGIYARNVPFPDWDHEQEHLRESFRARARVAIKEVEDALAAKKALLREETLKRTVFIAEQEAAESMFGLEPQVETTAEEKIYSGDFLSSEGEEEPVEQPQGRPKKGRERPD